ncbi:uncharacterized protein EV154DRAFT_567227 [Mucor mucedo]|uniref:uncharacterized protein n=1 Tax=Mucor mucedo TaxID=29922 RepID=UPI00221F0C4C|nr:uncharacterized protein EV154DRAFT_567227 [Mucor mucedo]KAI7887741.1 hypothetical protein EV154DRAFT_567227 [Mucor mucedo]
MLTPVSFGFGCEAITQGYLETDVGSLGFGRDCSSSVGSSLAFGQAFPPGDFAASSGSLPAVASAMEVDDVSVPVSGKSGVFDTFFIIYYIKHESGLAPCLFVTLNVYEYLWY